MMQKVNRISKAIIFIFLIGLTVVSQGTSEAQSSNQLDMQGAAYAEPAVPPNRFDGAVDQHRMEEIGAVLARIPTGRSTMLLLDKYDITVHFDSGHGSRFYRNRNLIVINSSLGKFSAALSLVHEATHARYYHEGLAVDPSTRVRGLFIEKRLEEETTAVVTGIDATKELAEIGLDITKIHRVLYYRYQQAAGAARRAAKYDNQQLSDILLDKVGRDAGRNAVAQAIVTGEFIMSTNQQSYVDYWGSIWDVSQGF